MTLKESVLYAVAISFGTVASYAGIDHYFNVRRIADNSDRIVVTLNSIDRKLDLEGVVYNRLESLSQDVSELNRNVEAANVLLKDIRDQCGD